MKVTVRLSDDEIRAALFPVLQRKMPGFVLKKFTVDPGQTVGAISMTVEMEEAPVSGVNGRD